MAYMLGLIMAGALFGLIPGIWAMKKGHKTLGIVSIVLCGLSGLFPGVVELLVVLVTLLIVGCSENRNKISRQDEEHHN